MQREQVSIMHAMPARDKFGHASKVGNSVLYHSLRQSNTIHSALLVLLVLKLNEGMNLGPNCN